jgi:collagenase-like PrtC family protease
MNLKLYSMNSHQKNTDTRVFSDKSLKTMVDACTAQGTLQYLIANAYFHDADYVRNTYIIQS